MTRSKTLLNNSLGALMPVIAVLLALAIGAVMLLALKVNPITAYSALIEGAVGSPYAITQTLVKATPLLLVGLGICIAFRGGVINIGGEGQIIVGGLATTAVTLAFAGLPAILLIPLGMLTGLVAGGIWGGIAGVLKARFGVNEILTTIMMNAIAQQLSNFLLRGPLIDPKELQAGTMLAQSPPLPENAWLPRLVPQTLLHAGVIVALVMAVVVYILLWRTVAGYRIRAVGLNPDASRYAGIRVPMYQALALLLSGALAGLAGSVEVMGVSHRMMDGVSAGYGFSGIVAALFGKLHPLGAIPASAIFGALLVGADKMQRAVQVPSALIDTLNGLIVLFVVSSDIYMRRRQKKQQTAAKIVEKVDTPVLPAMPVK
ncbi:MAG TPA: ABC transporter permease [Thermoflexales bacterium]|nr:ABC transporter permease [Thermoflexales bacterium]HQW36571.1 ABC transporter permease [Thermoflexales bacterium]HQZ22260.1 ABC transporter permease [Thermoflexales bacterium]HQZ99547.1 ABC transporter permease [Thermoflexales bacterium]